MFTNKPRWCGPRPPTGGHAIIERVIAELKNSALAHLPSGRFPANAAWLICATIAFNLTCTLGVIAGWLSQPAQPAPAP